MILCVSPNTTLEWHYLALPRGNDSVLGLLLL